MKRYIDSTLWLAVLLAVLSLVPRIARAATYTEGVWTLQSTTGNQSAVSLADCKTKWRALPPPLRKRTDHCSLSLVTIATPSPTPVPPPTPSPTPTPTPTPSPTGLASLTWVAPTANIDGSALTDLAGYHVLYGQSATSLTHTLTVAAPATSVTVTGLTSGTWYFAATAYTTSGAESDPSNVASKTVP